MTIEELKLRLKKILAEQREILDAADEETLTASEARRYDRLETKAKNLEVALQEARLNGGRTVGPLRPDLSGTGRRGEGDHFEFRNDEYRYSPQGTSERDYFNRYLLTGLNGMPTAAYLANEQRALQADLDVQGGWLVPRRYIDQMVQALDNRLFVRDLATKFQLAAGEVFAPALDADPGDPTWTAEIAAGSEDSDMKFGARELHPSPFARRIRISNKLMRLASISPEAIVQARLTATAGMVLENAYMTGDGVNSPLGFFVDSDLGIDSSRDRETATTGIVKADDIIDLVADLPAQFREGAVFIVNREFERRVRKLKDGEGNYLWKTGLDGMGNSLMGHRLYVSEYAPGADWTSGDYVACFGNLSHYWIVDSLNMLIRRLDELYAESDQTGFIFRYEGDAMPVLKQAFMRLKLK